MPTTRNRRFFTLADIAVLVAATAVGFALVKPALDHLATRSMQFSGAVEQPIFYALLCGTPVLIACSLALVGLSLRLPRPPLSRLFRSPGFVANASALAGVAVLSALYAVQVAIAPRRAADAYMHVLSTGLPGDVGYFVLGALVPMVAIGRGLPRRGWIDRVGWLIGLLWVVMVLLTWARGYLYLL